MSHPDLDEEAFALLQRCAVPLKDDLNSVVKRVALFYLNAHADQLDAGGRYTVEVDGEPHTRIGKAVQEMATERGIGIIRRSKAVLRKRWLQQFIDQGFFDGARGARL